MRVTWKPSIFSFSEFATSRFSKLRSSRSAPFGLEAGDVVPSRPQCLAPGQQKVAGIAGTHRDHVTHVPELVDAFKENDIHCGSPYSGVVGDAKPFTKSRPAVGEPDSRKGEGAEWLEDEHDHVRCHEKQGLHPHATGEGVQDRQTL